ncbi:MAG: diaminopimelate epimerase [Bryobacterales bacterium]|nr:diaminopimelate epimerase [Bryobacterales bacterium]
MTVPFVKAHGARNDFLLTWSAGAPAADHAEVARAICDRTAGIGADGWILVTPPAAGQPAAIRLLNSDGSASEISGNGTRCAAALLVDAGLADGEFEIQTGAGPKRLRLLARDGIRFEFEMHMGTPRVLSTDLETLNVPPAPVRGLAIDVGNPQFAVPVEDFDFDWRAAGAAIERHPRFPQRTNVSFLRKVDAHTIEVRFFERGAGETASSGTGSTGAVAAAMHLGWSGSPVTVLTPAGPLPVRDAGGLYLTGPAVLIGSGDFYYF